MRKEEAKIIWIKATQEKIKQSRAVVILVDGVSTREIDSTDQEHDIILVDFMNFVPIGIRKHPNWQYYIPRKPLMDVVSPEAFILNMLYDVEIYRSGDITWYDDLEAAQLNQETMRRAIFHEYSN